MRSWKPAAARKNYEREEWSRYAKQFNVLYSGKPFPMWSDLSATRNYCAGFTR
jgi:hypothetical protein